MIDLKKDFVDKKLLGEDCWLDLQEEFGLKEPLRVRIEYPSRSQMVEWRKLISLWESGYANKDTQHWIEYYFRMTVRDVVGLSIEGKEAKLRCERGLAQYVTDGDVELDVVAVFNELGLLGGISGLIREKLDFGDIEKKRRGLSQNSTATGNSPIPKNLPEQTSSTDGSPSPRTDEKILSTSKV